MTNQQIQHTIDCLRVVASEFVCDEPPSEEEGVQYQVVCELIDYFLYLLTHEDEAMTPEEAYERAMGIVK